MGDSALPHDTTGADVANADLAGRDQRPYAGPHTVADFSQVGQGVDAVARGRPPDPPPSSDSGAGCAPRERRARHMNVLSRVGRAAAATVASGILILAAAPSAAVAASAAPPAVPAAVAEDGGGPHFYNGVVVDVSDDVAGDVYATGQTVTVSGDVTGDVIAAAQTVTITGAIDGDIRLAGQRVTIDGEVSRSATIFAADIAVTDAGSIGDDLVGGAESVAITGEVGRDLVLGVGRLRIDGSVGGDVTYYSDRDAVVADGAVDGAVERIEPPQTPKVDVSPWAVIAGWFFGLLYALVALSLITLAAGLLVPRWLQRVTDHLVPSPWKALLVGFVASIAVPAALLVLAVTVVGAPLALAGLLVWCTLTLATFVVGASYLGRLLFRGRQHPVVTTLVGGVILIVALQVPWLNVLVWLAMVFFGLGAQLLEFQQHHPWRVERAPDAASAAHRTGTAEPERPSSPPPM